MASQPLYQNIAVDDFFLEPSLYNENHRMGGFPNRYGDVTTPLPGYVCFIIYVGNGTDGEPNLHSETIGTREKYRTISSERK